MFIHPDEQCLKGYSGILCLVCAPGYVQQGTTCTECPGGASFGVALVPLMVLCLLLYLCVTIVLLRSAAMTSNNVESNDDQILQRTKRMKKVNKMFGQVKILISLLQIVASMPFVLVGVNFSTFFQSVCNMCSIFNLDVLALSSHLICQSSVRFFDRFLIHLMLPVGCLMAIGLAVVTVRACIGKKKNTKHKRSKVNESVSKIVVLIILLIFPGLSTRIFSVFSCKSFQGIDASLLSSDYAIDCGTDEYYLFAVVASGFLVLYIAGIPLFMFLLLWKNKEHLHNVSSKKHLRTKNSLGGLYLQYEPDYWWFELMILLNKTIMCGGLVVMSPGTASQVLCAILFMMFHLLVVLKLSPFVKDSEDVSSVAAAMGLTLIYIGALMKMLEDAYDANENTKKNKEKMGNMSYVGVVLDALPVMCIGTVVAIIVVMDCGVYKRCCKPAKKQEEKKEYTKNSKNTIDVGEGNVSRSSSTTVTPVRSNKKVKVKTEEDRRAQEKVLNEKLNMLGGLGLASSSSKVHVKPKKLKTKRLTQEVSL